MSRRTPSPVDMTRPTILSVLQDRNPDITDEWAGKSYNNTTSGTDSFDLVKFDDTHPSVQKWADFTFEAIDLAYGDIYHQDIKQVEPNYQPVQLVDTNATSIVNEGSVDSLGSRWSHVVVKAPLRAAATHLRQSLGGPQQKPTLEHHLIEWTRPRALGQKPVTLKPDWAILENTSKICYREDKDKATPKKLTYVVGDSKLAQKWKSEWLSRRVAELGAVRMDPSLAMSKPHTMDVSDERNFPLDQVATYCRYGQTRYAFIFTQAELVALRIRRIRPLTNKQSRLQAAVEYASVPWHRRTGLTVNLAIWALACMGMNDDHREMETTDGKNTPLDRMARLTWWKYDAKGNVYQNVISGRKIPGSEWKKEYEKFVHLTEQAGNSFTSDFEAGYNPGSSQLSTRQLPLRSGTTHRATDSKPSASVQPVAQAGTVAKGTAPTGTLSTSTGPAAHPTASSPASKIPTAASKGPSAPKGPAPAPKGPSAVPKGPSAVPKGPSPTPKGPSAAPKGPSAAPKGPSAAPKGPSAVSKGPPAVPKGPSPTPKGPSAAPKGPPAAAPVPVSQQSGSAPSSSTPQGKDCVIGNTTYTAVYSSDEKKWKVDIRGRLYAVEFTKSKKFFVVVDGESLEVRWLKP